MSFSPDTSFIYYAAYDGNVGTLRRLTLIGGTAQTIVTDIDSPGIVSPDGTQIAFIRRDSVKKLSRLMLAPVDGSFEPEFRN